MNDDEKQVLHDAINQLEVEVTGIAISLSKSLSRLNDLQVEIKRLKALSSGEVCEVQQDLLKSVDHEEMLYMTLYDAVDSQFDLYQPTLAVLVRDCVKHEGKIPDSSEKDKAKLENPKIIPFIEQVYKRFI